MNDPTIVDKNTVANALINVLHLARDQGEYSLSLEELAEVLTVVLKDEEIQVVINSLLKHLKK